MSVSRIYKIKEYLKLLPVEQSIIDKLIVVDNLICDQFWREHLLGCNPSIRDFFTFMEVLTIQYQIALSDLAIKLDEIKVKLGNKTLSLLKVLSTYHSLAYCSTLDSLGKVALEYVKYYTDYVRPELIKVIKLLTAPEAIEAEEDYSDLPF